MTSAECNYGIGDKELLAIVESLKEYQPLVTNLYSTLQVYTDHSNLATLSTKKILNRRQARWAVDLAELDFSITYRPGKKNNRADALTRRSGDLSNPEGDLPSSQSIIDPRKIRISNLEIQQLEISALEPAFLAELKTLLEQDQFALEVFNALDSNKRRHRLIDLGACNRDPENLLLVNGLVYIPENLEFRQRLIKSRHDHPVAGHPGRAATFELISRDF
jgi:hypothetical protein